MSDADDTHRLTTELEIALLRELRASYHDLNAAYFKRGLRPAEIRLSDNARRLGQWQPDRRCIEMSRPLLATKPWGAVLEAATYPHTRRFVVATGAQVATVPLDDDGMVVDELPGALARLRDDGVR